MSETVREGASQRCRRWLGDLRHDVLHALRQIGRAPAVAGLVIGLLSVGIGATVTMAGAIDRLLLRAPAHVRAPEQVARLLFVSPDPRGGTRASARSSYPAFLDLARDVPAFAATAASSAATLSFGAGPDAVDVRAVLVSPAFFQVFGVTAALGRVFTPADGFPTGPAAGGPPLAVLAHDFWQRQFGGDRGVVGGAIRVGSVTYTVVGVAPRGFRGTEPHPVDVWLPITVAAEPDAGLPLALADRGATWLSLVARLRPGTTRAAAGQQATAVWRHDHAPPGTREAQGRVVAASVIRGRGPDKPPTVNVALWLAGVSGLVLLIVCANVTNLLLARAFSRRREMAVRLAIGAGRGRLARQLLADGLLLAAGGAVGALVIATAGGRLIERVWGADLAGSVDDGAVVDGRLFAVTAAVALGTGVLVSLAPILQTVSPVLTDALRAGAAAGGGRTARVRSVLLCAQAALCTLLLVLAGLFATSLRRVEGLDLGLDPDRTLLVRFGRGGPPLREADLNVALERVRAVPSVARAALAQRDPYGAGRAVAAHTTARSAASLWREGVMEVPMEVVVDSGFFRTVGTTSLRGRDFTSADRADAPRVAVINEPLARLLWPGEEALGQCLLLTWEAADQDCVRVVGVLGGFWRGSILNRDKLIVYVPLAQRIGTFGRPAALVVAARGDPALVAPAVRGAIRSVQPELPAVTVTRMRDLVDPEVQPWRAAATLFTLFGGVALLIAGVGLYGVVAFTGVQRAPEVAVRVALGAGPRHVLAVVAGGGLRAVAAGLAAGGVGALVARRWIGPLLFQTSPNDPRVVLGVVALLLLVAVLAMLVPLVRALRQDPATVLRLD